MSGLVKPSNLPSFDEIESVAKLKNRGMNDTAVAKKLGLQRKEVISLYKHYKDILVGDQEARDRAMELLNVMVEQYDTLIAETYDVIDKIRSQNFDDKYADKELKALAMVGDFIAKRLTMVQQAGLLEASELGDEYADIEDKANLLMSILKNDLCVDCRERVRHRIAEETGQVQGVVVYSE